MGSLAVVNNCCLLIFVGNEFAVKVADPELVAELENEVIVYSKLEDLQGKRVPKLHY